MESRGVSCEAFEAEVQRQANTKSSSLISEARLSHLNALSATKCYVLVKSPTKFTDAQRICSNAGGRLAWVLNKPMAADLMVHAVREGVMKKDAADKIKPSTAIWIGLERYVSKASTAVWNCPKAPSGVQDQAVDMSHLCYNPAHPFPHKDAQGSATLCNLGNTADCFCWVTNTNPVQLPFYCEIDALCSVESMQTCDDFLKDIQEIAEAEDDEIFKGSEAEFGDTCFVFVNGRVSWANAAVTCGQAGGRLAWATESLAQKLWDFASPHTGSPHTQIWIGLQQWGFEENELDVPYSVWRWACPADKGRGVKWLSPNYEYNGTSEGWDPAQPDPTSALPAALCLPHTTRSESQGRLCAIITGGSYFRLPYICEMKHVTQLPTPHVPVPAPSTPQPPVAPTSPATTKIYHPPHPKTAAPHETAEKEGPYDDTGLYVAACLIGFFLLFVLVFFMVFRSQRTSAGRSRHRSRRSDGGATDATGAGATEGQEQSTETMTVTQTQDSLSESVASGGGAAEDVPDSKQEESSKSTTQPRE